MESAFLEGKLKPKLYINLPKVVVEFGFIIQEEGDYSCAELIGGMYRCVDAAILYFVHFWKYSVSPKGLGLTQKQIQSMRIFRNSDEGKPKIVFICYVDGCCIIAKLKYVD